MEIDSPQPDSTPPWAQTTGPFGPKQQHKGTRKRALLLMPTSTYHAADFVEAAARLDIAVTVGVNGSQALQEKTPGSTLTLDFEDVVGATRRIMEFAESFPVHAVVATEDETTALAAAVASALGLPHNPIESVLVTRSKRSLRRALAAAALPSPGYRVLDLGAGFAWADEASRAAAEVRTAADALDEGISFPCVLKPTFLAASRGVIRADDAEEFSAAVRRIGAILHAVSEAGGGERGGESHLILVEDYIPGAEYALEAMLAAGELHLLALFDKPDPLEGPFFEETIYVTPSRDSAAVQEQIVATVEAAVSALGLCEGPLHAELRVNDDGAFIVDLAARSIGGLCPRVLRFGAGASLEELVLRHALGEDFSKFSREDAAAGVMMIPIPEAGVLLGIEGVEEAKDIEGIDEITFTINRGQELVPLPEGNRYLGFIFARADTPLEAEDRLRNAHGRLRFQIEGLA